MIIVLIRPQPGRKSRRRNARLAKAAAVAPRPVDKLKPIVRCPTIKYNRRVRAGRGFSLAELKVSTLANRLGRQETIAKVLLTCISKGRRNSKEARSHHRHQR